MNPEQKARLEELRKQNKVKLKAKGCDLSHNVLYEECVEAIKPSRIITDEKKIQKIIHDMSMSEINMDGEKYGADSQEFSDKKS